MKVIIGAILSLLLHATLGWQWTLLAGVVVGWWSMNRGWLTGALAVGLSWAGIVLWNYAVAADSMDRLTRTLAGFVDGSPQWIIPPIAVACGLALGAAGGLFGQAAARLTRSGDNSTQSAGESSNTGPGRHSVAGSSTQ